MRFSLKWLLAATAYAAVACASVVYAGGKWETTIGLVVTAWFAVAVVAAVARTRAARGYFAGSAVFVLLGVGLAWNGGPLLGDFPGVRTTRDALRDWMGARLLPYRPDDEAYLASTLKLQFASTPNSVVEVIEVERLDFQTLCVTFDIDNRRAIQEVSTSGMPNSKWALDAMRVIQLHLILLFSLLGGLLGLWFWKREEGANVACGTD